MIEDRMEEGLSEEEAVLAVGSVEEIIAQIMADTPPVKKTKRQMKAWEIVLLVLGSPIWLSLGIAAVSVIFSIYVVLWSVIVSLWAVFGTIVACSFAGVVAGVIFAIVGKGLAGMAMIGAGIVFAGLSIFVFYGCKAATKGVLLLTKKCFTKKEVA
jgi:uncharacterized membrane protein